MTMQRQKPRLQCGQNRDVCQIRRVDQGRKVVYIVSNGLDFPLQMADPRLARKESADHINPAVKDIERHSD